MNWRHSITLRLSLAFTVLATVVFSALGIYLGRAADAHMTELDTHELYGKLMLARQVSQEEADIGAMQARLRDALVGEHGVIVAVDGENGAVFRWPSGSAADVLAQVYGSLGEMPVRRMIAGQDLRVVAGSADAAWGGQARIVVARDIGHHTAFLNELRNDFGLAVLMAALMTALVSILIVRHGMRPVRKIVQAAGRISAGQMAERIPEHYVPPELAELVQAFNAMLGRLEESFQRLSDFSADLAHELRTPIHSLRMQTEVSLGKARGVEEYRDLLASNLEEYERLSRIIADMLFLAKSNHGLVVPRRETIQLRALCQRLFDYYGILAENISLELRGDVISVAGDRLMLERAIGNLLVNAIHHTPEAGQVVLSLSEAAGQAVISVCNSGPPIPLAAQGRIFDRFVRLGQDSEGSGLGLAITRSIVLAHRGQIAVHALEQATEFVIRLPIEVAESPEAMHATAQKPEIIE
jgi:two-component system, OmpR family, heavy metal sensor histidine kinase CusS